MPNPNQNGIDSVVWTHTEWYNASYLGVFATRSNPMIKALDAAVTAYEQKMKTPITPQVRIEELVKVLEAVDGYLASKGGTHSDKRTRAARTLKGQVHQEMIALHDKIRAGARSSWSTLRTAVRGGLVGRGGNVKRLVLPPAAAERIVALREFDHGICNLLEINA